MADYIDRQVAVEACRKNFVNKVFVADAVYNQGVENCLKRIKELPSAHPLDPCETCLHKSKGWDEEPCDGCTGTESKYKPDNGWIPVRERLPEEKEIVLITFDERVEMGRMRGESWEWLFESGWNYWVDVDNVTAWMPLPDPYKDRKHGALSRRF